jgi:hypothetical protein
MTKFDITTWFCKVVALAGMGSGALSLLGILLSIFSVTTPGPVSPSKFLGSGLSIATYFFLWPFAEVIGRLLTGENRKYGTPAARPDLVGLSIQCIGLSLLLHGFIATAYTGLTLCFFQFSDLDTLKMLPVLYIGALESILGFVLALAPRVVSALRSK